MMDMMNKLNKRQDECRVLFVLEESAQDTGSAWGEGLMPSLQPHTQAAGVGGSGRGAGGEVSVCGGELWLVVGLEQWL